ncbi:MAG: M23/M56 family metallopeptidase [Pseudomonadota bacterium]
MTAIALFAAFLLIASTLVAAIAAACAMFSERFKNWPTFWAVALAASIAMPAAAIALMFTPDFNPPPSFHVALMHAPLEAAQLATDAAADFRGEDRAAFLRPATIVALVYALGALVFLARLGLGRRRAFRIASAGEPVRHENGQTYVLVDAPVAPFAITPFGRPSASTVVVPAHLAHALSAAELNDVLLHERTHIRRRDDELGLAMRGAVSLCWISPGVRWLFSKWRESVEVQCDAAAISDRDRNHRKAYAATLVKALRITADRVLPYPAASFSTHRLRSEKMRIKQILSGSSPAFKTRRAKLALAGAAFATTMVGAMAMSASADEPAKKPNVHFMLTGRVTAKFDIEYDPFNTGRIKRHHGVDVAAPNGTPIYAPADGVILDATDLYDGKSGYGKVVVIETSDNTRTLFAHLDAYSVKAGQRVVKGAQIATVGNTGRSTGPHVHIETYRNGERIDPMTVWPITR